MIENTSPISHKGVSTIFPFFRRAIKVWNWVVAMPYFKLLPNGFLYLFRIWTRLSMESHTPRERVTFIWFKVFSRHYDKIFQYAFAYDYQFSLASFTQRYAHNNAKNGKEKYFTLFLMCTYLVLLKELWYIEEFISTFQTWEVFQKGQNFFFFVSF